MEQNSAIHEFGLCGIIFGITGMHRPGSTTDIRIHPMGDPGQRNIDVAQFCTIKKNAKGERSVLHKSHNALDAEKAEELL